jgi:hypothetical protein
MNWKDYNKFINGFNRPDNDDELKSKKANIDITESDIEKDLKRAYKEYDEMLSKTSFGYRLLKMRDGTTLFGVVLIDALGAPIQTDGTICICKPVQLVEIVMGDILESIGKENKNDIGQFDISLSMEQWIKGASDSTPYNIEIGDIMQVAMPVKQIIDAYLHLQKKKMDMNVCPKLGKLLHTYKLMDDPKNYDDPFDEPDMNADGWSI